MPVLIQRLSDNNVSSRMDAAGALGRIGPQAKAAIPALEAITKEKHIDLFPHVKNAVLDALERISTGN